MHPLMKFLIRAATGLIFGYVLARIFMKTTALAWILAAAAFLVAMAYLVERLRQSRQ